MVKGSTMPIVSSVSHKRKTALAATSPRYEPAPTLSNQTIEEIVEKLIAAGVKREDIVMPGSAANTILFIADDFDAPTSDFADYT